MLQRIKQRAQIGLASEEPRSDSPAGCLHQLRAALPEPLRVHLVGVLEKADGLTLLADSAVWAGRLKLALPDLADAAGHRPMTVRLDPGPRRAHHANPKKTTTG